MLGAPGRNRVSPDGGHRSEPHHAHPGPRQLTISDSSSRPSREPQRDVLRGVRKYPRARRASRAGPGALFSASPQVQQGAADARRGRSRSSNFKLSEASTPALVRSAVSSQRSAACASRCKRWRQRRRKNSGGNTRGRSDGRQRALFRRARAGVCRAVARGSAPHYRPRLRSQAHD